MLKNPHQETQTKFSLKSPVFWAGAPLVLLAAAGLFVLSKQKESPINTPALAEKGLEKKGAAAPEVKKPPAQTDGKKENLRKELDDALESALALTKARKYAEALSLVDASLSLIPKDADFADYEAGFARLRQTIVKVLDKEKNSTETADNTIVARMRQTVVPMVFFRDAQLSDVLRTLTNLSSNYDPKQEGFTFVLKDPENKNPRVSLSFQNMSLDSVLDSISKSIDCTWTINGETVEIRLNNTNP